MASERGKDFAAIREEHERRVGTERQILAGQIGAPAKLKAAEIDPGAITEGKDDIIATASETPGAERLTLEDIEANAREVELFFDAIVARCRNGSRYCRSCVEY